MALILTRRLHTCDPGLVVMVLRDDVVLLIPIRKAALLVVCYTVHCTLYHGIKGV